MKFLHIAAAAMMMSSPGAAQVATPAPPAVNGARPVTVERITIHSAAIEGNLEGNSADRTVLVLLPPSYRTSPVRRYPVVYALHGYSIGAEQWAKEIHLSQTAEGAFAKGAKEMIVVLPDSRTAHNGSMYSSSLTTGDFETFIARDLVAYIDGHYRTVPGRRSRGLVGHSMGGYGTTRIGDEASRHLWCALRNEPMLPFGAPLRAVRCRKRSGLASTQVASGISQLAMAGARPTGRSGGLVAEPHRAAALSRPAGKGR